MDGGGANKNLTTEKSEIKKEEFVKPVIPTVKVEPAEPERRIKQESEESDYIVVPKTPAAPIEKTKAMPAAPALDQSTTVPAGEFARVMAEITNLKGQVAALTQRVDSLEAENFQLQVKVEPMAQMEELRRYLGTADAKAPFELAVKCRKSSLIYHPAHS